MAFLEKGARCPFCGWRKFQVDLRSVEVEFGSGEPSEFLVLVCDVCKSAVLHLRTYLDGRADVIGVRVCLECRPSRLKVLGAKLLEIKQMAIKRDPKEFAEERALREAEPISEFLQATSYLPGTAACKHCQKPLHTTLWHGWNYILPLENEGVFATVGCDITEIARRAHSLDFEIAAGIRLATNYGTVNDLFPDDWSQIKEPSKLHPVGSLETDYAKKKFVREMLTYFQTYRQCLAKNNNPGVVLLRHKLDEAIALTKVLLR